MKRLLFFLFVLTSLSAVADTLDTYVVKYRGATIGTFNERQVVTLMFKADSTFSTDTIFVQVYRDAPCSKGCDYSLLVFGNMGPMLMDSTQHSASFYIPLQPLVEYHRKHKTRAFHGYYTEFLDEKGQKSRVVSFKITME